MTRIVTFTNTKGGSGKTTACAQISVALALKKGLQVLALDIDPRQGHLAVALGLNPDAHAYRFFEGAALSSCIVPTGRPGLDLIPGNEMNQVLESKMQAINAVLRSMNQPLQYPADTVRNLVDIHASAYDIVLIDTGPAGYLQEMAIFAADLVVAPTGCRMLDLDGLMTFLSVVDGVFDSHNVAPDDRPGVLVSPTMYSEQGAESAEMMTYLRAEFGDNVAEPISRRIFIERMPGEGQTIWEYAPKRWEHDAVAQSRAQFGAVAQLILERLGLTAQEVA